MGHIDFLSPAQIVGYFALVLGVIAFLQRSDWKLKLYNGLESFAYVVHFLLLGNPTAVVSAALSSLRSFLAIRIQSKRLAVVFIVANLGLGIYFLKTPAGLLPVIGSSLATWAAFTMKGIPMRVVLFVCTLCWLANNLLSGSIGGTILESFIATANCVTIVRMMLDRCKHRGGCAAVRAEG